MTQEVIDRDLTLARDTVAKWRIGYGEAIRKGEAFTEMVDAVLMGIKAARIAHTPSSDLSDERLRDAAKTLADKLDLIGPDPGGAFTMLHIRGMPYNGPTYADELQALRSALGDTQ